MYVQINNILLIVYIIIYIRNALSEIKMFYGNLKYKRFIYIHLSVLLQL